MMLHFKGGQVLATGTIVRGDAELRMTGTGKKVLAFSIQAENTPGPDGEYQKKYLSCVAWGDLAERFAGLRRYDNVMVAGAMTRRTWTNREGEERVSEACVCDYISLSNAPFPASAPAKTDAKQSKPNTDDFYELDNDGDLPF